MATVNLGAIKFNWKGAYNNSTAYVVDDVVSSGGSSYICILASQGNAVSNGTYWNIMSSAGTNGTNGTNGTDVGTVITTQGDLLYRDGSGLQRLAKGTAAQALLMNAGATAPEWGNLSSDFVKVHATNSASSSSSYHDYTFMSDTYQHYRVYYTDIASSSGVSHYLRVGNGSIDTASNYRWQSTYAANASTGSHGSTGSSSIRVGWSGDGTSYANSTVVDFLNCRNSGLPTTIFTRRWTKDHGSTYIGLSGHAQHETSAVIDRFRIYNDSGNITIKSISIYGIKQ